MNFIKKLEIHCFEDTGSQELLAKMVFILFLLLVVGGFLFYAPGWGFMDDLSFHRMAEDLWSGKVTLISQISGEMHGLGRFRPVMFLWIGLVYWVQYPLLIYLLVFLTGAYVLLLWGQLMNHIFFKSHSNSYVKWVFPLGFFLFPAFWNIFMYISVLEKFIFIFGTLSLYSFFKSYEKRSSKHLIIALFLAVVTLLGKETGVVFLISYAGFAFLDLVIFKRNKGLSWTILVTSIMIGSAYAVFIKSILVAYTAPYKANMTASILLGRFCSLSGAIKLILAISGASFLIFIGDTLRGRKLCDSIFVVFPLWILVYVLLLLPWGYPTYLLAPLGPFVMVCVYFLAFRIAGQQLWALRGLGIILITAIMLMPGMDIIPKISKMADKRKVLEAVKYLNQKEEGQFFYPQPYVETANNIRGFSLARVVYVDMINASLLEDGEKNYLVINDEASPVFLNGVDVSQKLYHNGTWEIWLLHKAPDVHKKFGLLLPQNILQKIKHIIMHS
ncbi:MAG: hypothetical protein HQL14_04165 [Candidatus Omnitrophica bacterium]|nr:hypothetical protein [Candidatus Omnitrophota bacterium]